MAQRFNLPFPVGGVNRRVAYFEQPAWTIPAASNVRPDCTLKTRERGGSRPALVKYSAWPAGSTPIRLIHEAFYTSSSAYASRLVASSGGLLYKYDETTGVWSAPATASATLTSDRPLMAADLLNKLYIASDASANDLLCVYDPATDALTTVTAGAGSIPTKCWICVRYRDRILLAGDRDNPNLVYASAQGDPTDWDYTVLLSSGAWSLSTASAGQIGQPVRALIPHGDDCCIVGCDSEIWVIRSDPNYGGSADCVSRGVGILDYLAWCHDDESNLWFMSHDGLYMMPSGCGSQPLSVSRERIPEELIGIDRSTHTVTMSYDLRDRGIHLVINGEASSAWWIDLKWTSKGDRTGNWAAFWPQSYQDDHYATYQYHRRATPLTKSLSLWGGSDGFVRRHDHAISQDDGGNDFDSYYTLLVPLAELGNDGMLVLIDAITALNSGDVDVEVRVASSPEAALVAPVHSTHSFNTAGVNCLARARARGAVAAITVKNGEVNARWAIERLSVELESLGLRR